MDPVREAKRSWRRILRGRLEAIEPAARARKSAEIVAVLRSRIRRDQPGRIALFAPMPVEVDLMPLLQEDASFVFPRIEGDDLTLWAVASADQLILQPHGLHEPDIQHCERIAPAELELVLVPGLGFGRDGSRLGRGKGYYDRLLAETSAVRIGIAFREQVEEAMPCHPWDQPVSELVTDQGWIRCEPSTSGRPWSAS